MKKVYLLLSFCFISSIGFTQNFGLQLDGIAEFLEVPHKPAYNAQANFTIEAWIYAENWKNQSWQGSIVNKDVPGPDRGYAFRAGDNGKLSFVMACDNVWNEVISPSVMNLQQWHHVAVAVSSNGMTLYVDGQAVANDTYTGTPSGNTSPVNIGASPGFGDRFFDGVVDEIRIWNVARTQVEIANNTTTDFTGTETGLVGYFPMNEGTGTIAGNLVDAACSATFNSMDASNWVGGYAIPDYDFSVQSIKDIDAVNMKVRPIKFSVDLQNLGLENLSNIDLEVMINGVSQYTETITQTLAPGEQINYQFTTPIDLTQVTDPEIIINGTHPDDQNAANNSSSIQLTSQAGNIVRILDQQAHNFGADGQIHLSNIVLPGDLDKYEQLLLHITLDCPTGGCDPWDQPANVKATTNSGTFEIARYVTPYGIACGPWTVDVTDFKNVLKGNVSFISYIQVWGSSGWLLTLDLELVEGNDPFPFSKIHPLWETDYWVYGDPGINDDLSSVSVAVASNTEASHIRMTNSGHGQGNTNNAAEFSNMTHDFTIGGSVIDNHNLWKADCASNACADQSGNWLFARAGWCPGQEVAPYVVNTTSNAAPNSTIEIDYDLDDYTNLLNTGYNGTSHTEPHYRIWSYFLERSSQRYEDYLNLACDAIDPVISGTGAGQTMDELNITITNTGSTSLNNYEISYFINSQWIASETIFTPIAPGETLVHAFTAPTGYDPLANNVFFGVVGVQDDESIGDDVAFNFVPAFVGTNELDLSASVKVFPNPTYTTLFQIELDAQFLGGTIDLMNANGQLVSTQQVSTESFSMKAEHNGMYFIRVTSPEGLVANKKIAVILSK